MTQAMSNMSRGCIAAPRCKPSCDDLAGGLEQNLSAAHLRSHGRVAGRLRAQVDLANILENNLQCPRSIGLIAVRVDVESVSLCLRIQISQKLRII